MIILKKVKAKHKKGQILKFVIFSIEKANLATLEICSFARLLLEQLHLPPEPQRGGGGGKNPLDFFLRQPEAGSLVTERSSLVRAKTFKVRLRDLLKLHDTDVSWMVNIDGRG